MARKIAVIGLGRLGVSIGMALAGKKDQFTTTGLDRNGDIAHEVGKLKVFDKLTNRLPEVIEGSDAVILAVPFDEVEITLKAAAPLITAKTLILDTSPVKKITYDWAAASLPAGSQFLSFTPIINAIHLIVQDTGIKAAASDLFATGLFLTCGNEATTSESTQFAGEIAEALGGGIYFGELAELDGLLAAYTLLPELAAAAYFNSVSTEGGWHYGCKLTNSNFATLCRPMADPVEREDFGAAALANRENTLRVMDNYLRELTILRDQLEKGQASELRANVGGAIAGHAAWWGSRLSGKWEQSGKGNMRGDEGFFQAALGIPANKKKK
jgi:prephenate dehydrogenase